MNPYKLISFAHADELARHVAGFWLDEIEAARRAGQNHCVALSGGRIAQKFFAAAAAQARERTVCLDHVHFFWADERCVPPDDPESNFKLANELLFAPLKIPENQIHRLHGEEPPEIAVKIAEAELRRWAPANPNQLPVLDLILLGMGEDGHVASLFPQAPPEVLNCAAPFLAVDHSPKPPPRRISLSYAALAAAQRVWVLVSGPGKESALRASLSPAGRTPLAHVLQSRRCTKIFCDILKF
jgi:6-phosphogluconolactonase